LPTSGNVFVVGTLRDGPERSTLVGQLYWVPHGLLLVFNTILYENEFQNPQIFYLHVRFSPERSILVGQLYWVPHGLLLVFNTILYENEFQNPQVFHQHLRFSPERSTLYLAPRL
jgi:hypothetical protein